MKHYVYGGSTAARTENCAAWRQLSEGIPNIESAAALTGTAIHYLLEQCNLEDIFVIGQQLGKTCPETGLVYTPDMIELAQDMWNADVDLARKYSIIEWEAETTGEFDEDTGSTVDKVFSGYTPEGKRCTVLLDYKSGRGKQVDAVGNAQLLHNAWCLMHNSEASDLFDDAEILVAVIIQPNRAGEVQTKEWQFTKEMVWDFRSKHLLAISKTKEPGVKPVAGEHCAFCPAEATCPAKTGDAHRALLRDPENLEQLSENMALVEQLKPWLKAVEKAIFESLELGSEVAGWKLVNKQAREAWVDEAVALKALRLKAGGKKNIAVDKLMTPAQVRKVLKSRNVEIDFIETGLTDKKSSGTTIAPESDKREAVLSAAAFGAALASVS